MKVDDGRSSGSVITIIKIVIVAVAIPFIILNVWAYLPYQVHSVGEFFNIPFVELGQVAPTHRFVTVIGTDLMFGWALTSAAGSASATIRSAT